MLNGISRTTGDALAGIEHVRQSIADILTTPIGSRVMRRDYGSLIPRLIDQPMNDGIRLEVFAAAADALRRWEPRIIVRRVEIDRDPTGKLAITVRALYRPLGEEITIDGVTVS